MFTGYRPSPALSYPSLGSGVSHEFCPREGLPPYVCIPNEPNPYAGPGYLSSAYGPFSLGADPASGGFKVRDLNLPAGIDDARFTRRRSALDAVNAHFESLEKSDAIAAMDTFYQRAYSLISSPKAREAFNIDAEPAAIRDEYGRNQAGQRFLMARRLIAAGVRVATLTYGGWDFHQQIVPGTKSQAPIPDQALAALIRDLDRTGLFDETIVMLSTEFGRTPKVNGTAGRDHWPKVFSIVLAGGGFARGKIFGSFNATASERDTEAAGLAASAIDGSRPPSPLPCGRPLPPTAASPRTASSAAATSALFGNARSPPSAPPGERDWKPNQPLQPNRSVKNWFWKALTTGARRSRFAACRNVSYRSVGEPF